MQNARVNRMINKGEGWRGKRLSRGLVFGFESGAQALDFVPQMRAVRPVAQGSYFSLPDSLQG